MLFGLKNVGATYQWAMVTLSHDMMHNNIELYINDVLTKTHTEQNHVQTLRKLFERLKKYQLKLNPSKCTFEVKSRKLLRFAVSNRGIKVYQDKVKVIQEMSAPKIKKEGVFREVKLHNSFCLPVDNYMQTNLQLAEEE